MFTQSTIAQTGNFVENCGFHRFENMASELRESLQNSWSWNEDWNEREIKAFEQPQIIIGTKFSNNKTAVKQLTLTKLTRGECAKCTRSKSIENAFYWSSKKESQV